MALYIFRILYGEHFIRIVLTSPADFFIPANPFTATGLLLHMGLITSPFCYMGLANSPFFYLGLATLFPAFCANLALLPALSAIWALHPAPVN